MDKYSIRRRNIQKVIDKPFTTWYDNQVAERDGKRKLKPKKFFIFLDIETTQ